MASFSQAELVWPEQFFLFWKKGTFFLAQIVEIHVQKLLSHIVHFLLLFLKSIRQFISPLWISFSGFWKIYELRSFSRKMFTSNFIFISKHFGSYYGKWPKLQKIWSHKAEQAAAVSIVLLCYVALRSVCLCIRIGLPLPGKTNHAWWVADGLQFPKPTTMTAIANSSRPCRESM